MFSEHTLHHVEQCRIEKRESEERSEQLGKTGLNYNWKSSVNKRKKKTKYKPQ